MFQPTIVIKKLWQLVLALSLIFVAQLTLPIPHTLDFDYRFRWLLIGIVVFYVLVDLRSSKALARNAFLLLATFGTVIALVRPVQYALDEETHLNHTIGLWDSPVFKYSDEDLKDYEAVFLHDAIRNVPNYKDGEYFEAVEHQDSVVAGQPIGFDNPVYLPASLGWNLGEVLSNRVQVSYYLGRIGTVLAYAFLVFLAIKISLVYKEGIFLLGTLPSALYVTAGFHYDYLYYGASLLMIAILTNILSGKQVLTVKKVFALQGLAFAMIFAKFPYVLLGALPLFIPQVYCKNKRVKWYAAGGFGLVMILAVIYSGIINLFPVSTFASSQSPGIFYFLQHPLPIVRTFIGATTAVLDNFIARPLQYISHESGLLMVLTTVYFISAYTLVSLKTALRISRRFQVLTLGMLAVIVFLTIYAITGDPRVYTPGDIMVGGVQGRYYFFPLAILPVFIGDWIHRYVTLSPLSEDDNERFVGLLQAVNALLMVFTISVALYTQI